MFFLKNLSAAAVEKSPPWEFDGLDLVPKNCLGKDGKKARHCWATDPKTDYQCYSFFEGVNANGRIRSDSKSEEGNPPWRQHGLAVDYDYKLTEQEIAAGIERMPSELRPQWREETLSGNLRLVWVFAFPLSITSYAFAVSWLQTLHEIIPFRNLAGIDEGALKAPERYYTNGARWRKVNPNPFPHALLMGHYIKFCDKFDFIGKEGGVSLPMEIAAQELAKKYPKFSDWPGEFTDGSKGPTFWIEGSTSPMSAVAHDWGIFTFCNHANGHSKWTWPELIGNEFVSRYRTEQIGRSCDGIYYDEKSYYSKNAAGRWCIDPKDNISLFLKHERGLSDIRKKGETTSEIERALCHIQRRNRVRVAAPFPFFPEGMTELLGETVLNTHTRKAIAPAECAGPFPFIENFLKTFFNPSEQLDYFISWLAYVYRACVERSPRSGQALYIVGGMDIGKTCLNRGIIGGLCGGFAECQQYILGEDNFNSELFEYAIWCIDDGSITPSFMLQKKFTEKVKALVANPTLRCRGLYQKGGIVLWMGRIVITMNLDAESKRLLPDMDLSMRGKVMLLRAVETPQVKFFPRPEMEAILARELPYFGRFLMDWVTPEHCISEDPRFGVATYLEKSLVDSANQNSASGAFAEILDDWRRTYFTQEEPTARQWEGTSLQLYKSILQDRTLLEAMRRFDLQSVGRNLKSLAAKNVFNIRATGSDIHQIFTIPRDETQFPFRPEIIAVESSKFIKPA